VEGFFRCTEFALHRQSYPSLVLLSAQCAALCLCEACDACWLSFPAQTEQWVHSLAAFLQSKTQKVSKQASMHWYMLSLQVACAASISPAALPQPVQALLAVAACAPEQGCFSKTESTEAFIALHRLRAQSAQSLSAASAWSSRAAAGTAEASAAAASQWSFTQASASPLTQVTAAVTFALAGIAMQVLEEGWGPALVLLPLLVSAAVLLHQGRSSPFSAHNTKATREYVAGGIKGQVFRSNPSQLRVFPASLGERDDVQLAAADLTLPTPPDADAVLTMVQVDLTGAQVRKMNPRTKEYAPIGVVTAEGSLLSPSTPHEPQHALEAVSPGGSAGGIGAAEEADPLEQLRRAAGLRVGPAGDSDSLAVQLLPTGSSVEELPAMLAQHASQHTEQGGGGPLLLGADATPGAMPMPLPKDLLQTLQDLLAMLLESGDVQAAEEVRGKIDFAQSLLAGGPVGDSSAPQVAGVPESKEPAD